MGDVTDGGDWTSADDYCGHRPTDICSICPRCKQPTVLCNCESVIQLWMVDEFKFDQPKEHDHHKKNWLFTNKWEDVVYLWCQNLITIGKYKKACEEGKKEITQNETMHDYILTRFENIDGCYSSLYLGGKLTKSQFEFYEKTQTRIVDKLTGEDGKGTTIPVWEDFELFDNYLKFMLNSQFFEENDIRIDNCTF